jgi:thymidylate synthase (FAD)
MKVELLNSSPLWVCAKAIRKCWASEDKSDTEKYCVDFALDDPADFHLNGKILKCGEKDKELIHRVGNKNKHKSTLEHLVYTFDIDGISRACLQELARHRVASYSVKSTRYTLKELGKDDADISNFYVKSGETLVDNVIFDSLSILQELLKGTTIANDKIKYMLPEAYKTSLVMTINARALQNFLELRTAKSALWEIQELAVAMYYALPDEHKYLFEDIMKEAYLLKEK